jgi:hypothetical protein
MGSSSLRSLLRQAGDTGLLLSKAGEIDGALARCRENWAKIGIALRTTLASPRQSAHPDKPDRTRSLCRPSDLANQKADVRARSSAS